MSVYVVLNGFNINIYMQQWFKELIKIAAL